MKQLQKGIDQTFCKDEFDVVDQAKSEMFELADRSELVSRFLKPIQMNNAHLTAQTIQYNPDFFLGAILPTGLAFNRLN